MTSSLTRIIPLCAIFFRFKLQFFKFKTKRDRLYQQYRQNKNTRTQKKHNDTKMKDVVKGWGKIDSCVRSRCSDIVYTKNVIRFIY